MLRKTLFFAQFVIFPLTSLAGSALLRPAEIKESCALAAVGIYLRTAVEVLAPEETTFKLAEFKNSVTKGVIQWEQDGAKEVAQNARSLLDEPENFSMAFVRHDELLNLLSVARKTLNVAQSTQYSANEKQSLFRLIQRSRDVEIGVAIFAASTTFIASGVFFYQMEALKSLGASLMGFGIGAAVMEAFALWLSSKIPPRDSSPLGDDPNLIDTPMDLWLRAQFDETEMAETPNFIEDSGILIFRSSDSSEYLIARIP